MASEFPWRELVVFRAGRYLVHEVGADVPNDEPEGTNDE
jgi:hypothetical protein